jgi:hypothetical protein
VERRGNDFVLTFSTPRRTSDNSAIRGRLTVSVCAWLGVRLPAAAAACSQPELVETVQPSSAAKTQLTLPLETLLAHHPDFKGQPVALAVTVANSRGMNSGWSNVVVAPTLVAAPAPSDVSAEMTANGVVVRWRSMQPPPSRVRVYRQLMPLAANAAPAAPEVVATLPGTAVSFLDTGVERNRTYRYFVRSVVTSGTQEVESSDSAVVPVIAKDVFPPPVPSGLQAVLTPGSAPGTIASVDLSWSPVTASDLAGYNVYRRSGSQAAWERRNTTPLFTPVFHDTAAAQQPGTFEYAVTAFDQDGNESAKSAVAVVVVRGLR